MRYTHARLHLLFNAHQYRDLHSYRIEYPWREYAYRVGIECPYHVGRRYANPYMDT
jgi:hypothetical protein